MRDRIFALLGIESGEERMVALLLTQSVFLGIFFGAFDISAHSLFLSIFDEKMMARGYVVSGFAGIILTSLYTWLQTKVQFKIFSTINLFSVTAFTLLLWIGLLLSPAKWVIFLVFIMLGPLNILAALGFWGTAGRLFTLRQGKRLFGLIDSGVVIGIIISCYTIPVLLALRFESHNILLVSACSIFVATMVQIMIGSRFSFVSAAKAPETPAQKKEKRSILTLFRQDRYIRFMAVFVALSVMTAFFVQYSFMAVTREQYPAEEDMARFLGIFTGSMMIFTLLVKLLAFSFLIRNYGLKISLAISPILLAVFTAIAIGIGLIMGYTPGAGDGFLIFFLVLALSRLFSKSLKDSMESPSFKVIYQTIDEKVRYEIQSGMDGTVNEISALSSGLILAGLGILSFIKLIHFSIVLFVLIVAWMYMAFMLYSEYRKSIRKALEATGTENATQEKTSVVAASRFSAAITFKNDYFRLISGDFQPLERNRNKWYLGKIIDHTKEKNDVNLIPALKKISSATETDQEIKSESEALLRKLENQRSANDSSKSGIASKLLSGSRVPQTTEILRLLRDNSIESKRAAILIIGKFRIKDMITEVCSCISIQPLETDAVSVLTSFGADAVPELIRSYLAASGNINTSRTLLLMLAKAETPEASAFLFSRLWSNSRLLRETAAEGLISCGFRPAEEDLDKLHQMISDTIGLMTWNLSAKVCLEKNNEQELLKIFNKDISRWRKYFFNLLSIAYDAGSINKIRENLESDTVESGNFALEMIDIVIDESIKPKVIALLDIIPDEDKLKTLYQFFPGEVPTIEKLKEDIINRDYNLINLWTKACTLRNIPALQSDSITESASALLFSPEQVLQEEAARLMSRSEGNIYNLVSARLPESSRRKLDSIIKGEVKDEELAFEKVNFLSGCFDNIPEDELMSLTGTMTYFKELMKEETFAEDCIIWPLDGRKGEKAIIHYTGADPDRSIPGTAESMPGYFLPLAAVEEFRNHYPEGSAQILAYIDNNED
jgi:ATP/ADP translocase